MAWKSLCYAGVLALMISAAAAVMPVWADDGVVLINQAKVIVAGGFPYSINTAGSYRLAGNLTVSSPVNAINVTAAPVTIDLNGFTITGSSLVAVGILGSAGSLTVSGGTIQSFLSGVDVITTSGAMAVHDLTVLNASVGVSSTAPIRLTNVSIRGSTQAVLCESDCILLGSSLNSSQFGVITNGGTIVAVDNLVLAGSFGFAISGGATGGTAALLDNTVASSSGGSITGVSVLPLGPPVVVAASRNVFNTAGGTCLSGSITSLGDNVCNGTKQ